MERVRICALVSAVQSDVAMILVAASSIHSFLQHAINFLVGGSVLIRMTMLQQTGRSLL